MSPPVKAMIVIVAAVALSTGVALYNRTPELVPWRTDAAAAMADAKSAGKPTLLYFTADWCGPCVWMKENTWTDPGVAKALEGYVPVKVDIDKQEELAIRYRVEVIPRLVVLNPDGTVHRDIARVLSPTDFVEWLR